MLKYEVQVVGLEIDGHAEIKLFTSISVASKVYDDYCKLYPQYTIKLYELTKALLKDRLALIIPRPTPICPRGHNGVDYRKVPVILMGTDGKYRCNICGWKEGEEVMK